MNGLEQIIGALNADMVESIDGGFHFEKRSSMFTTVKFTTKVTSLIWPSREGELIEDVNGLPTNFSYSLSYPGTASTKSIVLFVSKNEGVFMGGKPTERYCKMRVKRISADKVEISLESTEHNFVLIPFKSNWTDAIKLYKDYYGIVDSKERKIEPKFLLQIGAIPPEGKPKFESFDELRVIVDKFYAAFGSRHIIHFFGTDSAGFDRMFPRFNIAPEVGGEKGLEKLLQYIHRKGYLTSHHFIPRIADYDWVAQNPSFKDCVILDARYDGVPVIELYKGHPFYVMDITNPRWFDKCLETIERLHRLGFDYVQLDQFSYQRTFYNESQPLASGYAKLIAAVEERGINYWLEGVNDIYHPKGRDFCQILVRNTPNLWDDFELRRGYPFGRSYPEFYTTIYPNDNYSYQLVTENKSLDHTSENLIVAKKIKAMVYDLQMDYFSKKYMDLLLGTIELLGNVN